MPITKPDDATLVQRLELKLQEYERRRAESTEHPVLRQREIYKERTLSAVLNAGAADLNGLIPAWQEEFGDDFDLKAASDAFTIVEGYCTGEPRVPLR